MGLQRTMLQHRRRGFVHIYFKSPFIGHTSWTARMFYTTGLGGAVITGLVGYLTVI